MGLINPLSPTTSPKKNYRRPSVKPDDPQRCITVLDPSLINYIPASLLEEFHTHSVPPIEVECPESPPTHNDSSLSLPSEVVEPPSLVKSPVFAELPVAFRALYRAAADRTKIVHPHANLPPVHSSACRDQHL